MIKEYLIILLLLATILVFIFLLYSTGILKRKVLVTTVENLPIGIFKENKGQSQEEIVETYFQENSESDENELVECNNQNVRDKSENDLKKEFSPGALETLKENNLQNKEVVYWTPQGKHYHKIHNCGALLRSKVINSSSIEESGKLTGCTKCSKS